MKSFLKAVLWVVVLFIGVIFAAIYAQKKSDEAGAKKYKESFVYERSFNPADEIYVTDCMKQVSSYFLTGNYIMGFEKYYVKVKRHKDEDYILVAISGAELKRSRVPNELFIAPRAMEPQAGLCIYREGTQNLVETHYSTGAKWIVKQY